jgi:hypothetical protein
MLRNHVIDCQQMTFYWLAINYYVVIKRNKTFSSSNSVLIGYFTVLSNSSY